MRWTLLFLLIINLFLLARTSTAEEQKPLALIVLPGRSADLTLARSVRKMVLQTFASEQRVQLIDPLKVSGLQEGDEAPAYKTDFQRGKQELREKRYRPAVQSFMRAITQIKTGLALVPKAALSEAMHYLAAAQLGAGHRAQALQTLCELLVWRPQQELELKEETPRGWDELVDEAKQWLLGAAKSSIDITSVPSGAEAFVDGRRLGPTPVLSKDLVIGTHYITLLLEGYRRTLIPVEVKEENEPATIEMMPNPSTAGLFKALEALQPSLGESRLRKAERLKEELGLTQALFLVVDAGPRHVELHAYFYDLNTQQIVSTAKLHVALPLKAESLLSLASIWKMNGSEPRPKDTKRNKKNEGPEQDAEGEPWYTSWWIWGVAGGVSVVALAVALPLALRDGSSSTGENERFQLRW